MRSQSRTLPPFPFQGSKFSPKIWTLGFKAAVRLVILWSCPNYLSNAFGLSLCPSFADSYILNLLDLNIFSQKKPAIMLH